MVVIEGEDATCLLLKAVESVGSFKLSLFACCEANDIQHLETCDLRKQLSLPDSEARLRCLRAGEGRSGLQLAN